MEGKVEKRVKRHILSRTYRFLGVIQPAFREIARREMEEEGFRGLEEVDAGIEFEGPLEEGWRANLVLRTISRVYCRVDSFRAGAREELYRKARGIPWELWIPPGVPLRVDASAHASRIHHEGILRKTLLEAICDRFKEVGCPVPMESRIQESVEPENWKDPAQRILVHSEGHRCTISLDMSGEGLYRRGYRAIPGEAPIREDIAAALLRELGWKGCGILCDPMTGSGTFPIEGSLMDLKIPPGWNRRFQFQTWPSFLERRWNFLRKQEGSRALQFPQDRAGHPNCFASDRDATAIERAKANSRAAGVEARILFEQKDFFSLNAEYVESRILREKKEVEASGERFLVLNPPYGKRLEVDEEYPIRLWEHIRKSFPHWRVLLLSPSSVDFNSLSNAVLRKIIFRHGGLRVQALFLKNDYRTK